MSKQVFPLMIINMCCEAIYITAQRLTAQRISSDKSSQVLNAMVQFIFSISQLRDMFTPKDARDVLLAVRQAMDGMCNCSVMKIAGNSMDKIMDLAVMAFKYQVMCSSNVDQILEITRLHLTTTAALIQSQPSSTAAPRVAAALASVNESYGGLGRGELHRIRQNILGAMQGQRVKVSIMMEGGIQTKAGTLVLPSPSSPRVGVVTLYGDDGKLEKETTTLEVLGASQLAGCEFFSHPAPLGSNLYARDQVKLPDPGSSSSPSQGDTHPIGVPLVPRPDAAHYVAIRADG